MRFSMRRMLVLLTAVAIVCGYFGWRKRQERINYVLYDAPGEVDEREYWPQPVSQLVGQIEGKVGEASKVRVYRHFNERKYNYCDAFFQMPMTPNDYEEIEKEWGLEPVKFRRRAHRFLNSIPAEWRPKSVHEEARLVGTPSGRWTGYGTHFVMLYDKRAQTLHARVTNDF